MRCIPVLFGVDVKDDFPIFFGAFYKFCYYCSINDWPIIAQEEYFINPSYYEKKFPINLKKISFINEIPSIKKIKFEKVDKFIITNDQTKKVLDQYKDKDTAWINMMNNKDNVLYKIMDDQLSLITKKYDDLKSLIVWRHNETISLVAKKYNLNVIEMELAGIRKPSYNLGICYFQYSNKYSTDELDSRYESFIKEIKNKKVPLLSRNDLINLFVSKEELNNLYEIEDYDVGIALGLRNDYDTLASGSITNEEILESLDEFESKKNIIIRKHPANHNYKYNLEDKFTLDESVSSIQFLSRCRKIVSSVSNIGLEAMLFGKTSYTLGKMPFKRFCYNSLDINDDYVISVIDLNFLIFCYFTPYSLALDQHYVEFRNSNPSEYDIYMCHYKYIMKDKNIKKSYKAKKVRDRYFSFIEKDQIREKYEKLKEENDKTKEELNSILYSRSWRFTKPLRALKKKR